MRLSITFDKDRIAGRGHKDGTPTLTWFLWTASLERNTTGFTNAVRFQPNLRIIRLQSGQVAALR